MSLRQPPSHPQHNFDYWPQHPHNPLSREGPQALGYPRPGIVPPPDPVTLPLVTGHGREAAGGFQGSGVGQVATGNDADVAAFHQRAVSGQAVVGVGQIQHGHQHGLAIDDFALHPDDVVGQGCHLLGGERGADGEVQGRLGSDAVVHQVLELTGIAGLAVDVAGAGFGDDGLVDQGLFVEAVAQAFFAGVGVVAQGGQHVVRAHELLEVGERRAGFNQVFLWLGGGAGVRYALYAGHGLAGCGGGLYGGDGKTNRPWNTKPWTYWW